MSVERLAYRPDEVAAAMNISPKTVRRWIENGTLKSRRVGRLRFIAKEELERLLQEPVEAVS